MISDTNEAFAELWNSVLHNQEAVVDYNDPRPVHLFLQYLVDHHDVVLHGSNTKDLSILHPFHATGVEEDQALLGVYATDSAPEAIFFAILNRPVVGSFSSDTYGTDYEVDKFTSAEPWCDGVVYILPKTSFKKVGGFWVSREAVKPQSAIHVSPSAFPYLKNVRQNRLPWWMKWVFKIIVWWQNR
ncbi:MAG: hypothetical protein AAF629_08600 [Chloroflexota bacterium]